jgi:hypothetical protein
MVGVGTVVNWLKIAISLKMALCRTKRSIKRDVKKKALPRPEGEKILSRDPAHYTVRVPLDFARGFASELSSIPVTFIIR